MSLILSLLIATNYPITAIPLGKTSTDYECKSIAWYSIPWISEKDPIQEFYPNPLKLPYYRYDANGGCFFIWHEGAPLG